MVDIGYPIGRFEHTGPVTDEELKLWISQIDQTAKDASDEGSV